MRVIARKTLKCFYEVHPDAEGALKAWYAEAKGAEWRTPQDIRDRYRSADFLAGDRVIFNIRGNRYRLIVEINYSTGIVYIRWFGSHADYDRIDAERI